MYFMQIKYNLLLLYTQSWGFKSVMQQLILTYFCILSRILFIVWIKGKLISSIYSDFALQSEALLNAFQAVPIVKLC